MIADRFKFAKLLSFFSLVTAKQFNHLILVVCDRIALLLTVPGYAGFLDSLCSKYSC